jgi:hypothetical protein
VAVVKYAPQAAFILKFVRGDSCGTCRIRRQRHFTPLPSGTPVAALVAAFRLRFVLGNATFYCPPVKFCGGNGDSGKVPSTTVTATRVLVAGVLFTKVAMSLPVEIKLPTGPVPNVT